MGIKQKIKIRILVESRKANFSHGSHLQNNLEFENRSSRANFTII